MKMQKRFELQAVSTEGAHDNLGPVPLPTHPIVQALENARDYRASAGQFTQPADDTGAPADESSQIAEDTGYESSRVAQEIESPLQHSFYVDEDIISPLQHSSPADEDIRSPLQQSSQQKSPQSPQSYNDPHFPVGFETGTKHKRHVKSDEKESKSPADPDVEESQALANADVESDDEDEIDVVTFGSATPSTPPGI
jgi:hypothetical protein